MAEIHLAALVGFEELEREAESSAASVATGGDWASRPVRKRVEAIARYGA